MEQAQHSVGFRRLRGQLDCVLEIGKHPVIFAALFCSEPTPNQESSCIFWVKLQDLFQVLGRRCKFVHQHLGHGASCVGIGILRLQLNRLLGISERSLEIS